MREIKFRAWDKEEERIRDWKNLMAIGYGPNKIMDSEIDDSIFNDDQFQLMQFTGLYDKDGKEIYEGDVVEVSEPAPHKYVSKLLIKWDDDHCGFICDSSCPAKNIDVYYYYKVIGNIYENPELIA